MYAHLQSFDCHDFSKKTKKQQPPQKKKSEISVPKSSEISSICSMEGLFFCKANWNCKHLIEHDYYGEKTHPVLSNMVKKPGACWWDSVPLTWSCIFTQVLKRRLWTSLAAVLIMKRLPGGEAWWESSHVPQSLCLIPTPCVSVFSEVAFELPSVCSLTSKLWQKLPISSSQGEKLWGCVCGRRGRGGGGGGVCLRPPNMI